jgi:hypothetical protein
VVSVDATFADAPGDDDVRLTHLEGTKEQEGVLEVKSSGGTSYVLNDCINNLPKLGGFFGFILAPTGIPSVPRIARWMMVKDKPAFRSHLERMAGTPDLRRVIVSHGAVLSERPGDVLRSVAAAIS